MTDIESDKTYSAPALEKGLDILEDLAEMSGPISLRDLADRLGRSKNEIFRMIHVLISRGYIERDGDTDELALTNKLFGLGLRTPQSRSLMAVAMPEMEKLAAEVRQTAHIVTIYKGRTVTLGHSSSNPEITFNLNTGYGRLASDATTGRVIMAFQPERRLRQILVDCDKERGQLIEREHLERALDAIRTDGHLLRKSTDWIGITDVCCPILDQNGNALASIIVTVIDHVTEPQDHSAILALMKHTCRQIHKTLFRS
ncbi:DNA-binding IclR family transcriptional regulator [Rhizobium azooxidifex]|uniref:DNA-binding IclR family transcriptional regulator n=1 Tax=Mycoplana azooxidifex TaxID=1636188 RepID=A0A7W6GLY4_9HYPH|nr:IclR family transcriptional regulator [Mycoplana azooxidifex]MBB3979892.1 DNA-binding IclR family transcriptional regulator [Mycoplana azooxidifex]